MEEEWKFIEGFNQRYSVSNTGHVRNNKTGRVLVNVKKDTGYTKVKLKGKNMAVHRLVMMTFKPIDNPEKYEVDHLDNDRANNRLDNLEWVTPSENQTRRFRRSNEGMPDKVINNSSRPKRIIVKNCNNGVEVEFRSLQYYCKFMGFAPGTVYKYMSSGKLYKGYFIRRV